MPTVRLRDKIERDRQIRDVVKNEGEGKMHRLDMMDTVQQQILRKQKLEICQMGVGGGVIGVKKIIVLDGG